MPVIEGRMEMGAWSVTLGKDTPLSLREALWRWWSHIVITPAWLDPAQTADAGILAAARYSGPAMNVGPQRRLSGYGNIWWLGDPREVTRYVGSASVAATWSTVYSGIIAERLRDGTFESGGAFTEPRIDSNRRQKLDRVIRGNGHEWRVNPDFTFDAGLRATLYGTTPTVILVEGGGGRDLSYVGLDADVLVEGPDYEDWTEFLYIQGRNGSGQYVASTSAVSVSPDNVAILNYFKTFSMPDVPPGAEDTVAGHLGPIYNQPRYQITVDVKDEALVEHVDCGDLIYVYNEVEGVRDFDNQVTYGGRTIWPKLMRVVRMNWPVRQGMGVYWREHAEDTGVVTYYDLTPYVEWETGNATLELVEGEQLGYYINPSLLGDRTDAVAVAQEIVNASPWDTYTPTWGGTISNPAIGNGSLTGAYRREGTTLHFRILITFGSTTTYGSGDYTLTLPPDASATTTELVTCKYYSGAVGSDWQGSAYTSGGFLFPLFPTSSGDVRLRRWSNSAPASSVNGGNFLLQGTLELTP